MQDRHDSTTTTRGVHVTAVANFVPEQSHPLLGRWFFAYRIRISNLGDSSVQLLSRHWVITDAHGSVEEVRGPGVVGEQPVLPPGETFEYTSFCPLETPFGTMEGSYEMITDEGERFWATVGRFTLSQPLSDN